MHELGRQGYVAGSPGEGAPTTHTVVDEALARFTWDYEKAARPGLNRLYEKAKGAQWNAETDLDWSIEVDPVAAFSIFTESQGKSVWDEDDPESPVRGWDGAKWEEFSLESFAWRMSQFLHGEQGALLCTAKIVETVPWIDAKYYAATQVMDEARHVEVFGKYLDTKIGFGYPINPHLGALLDDILRDSRWDITYLGMQIMVEGLALAAFGFMQQLTPEPLLKQLLRYVMSDEARHVAFGVLSLQELYGELTEPELRERQEFAYEAAVRMRDRFLQQEVWEKMGADVAKVEARIRSLPEEQKVFQQMLFSKIVPNCRKLGLLDAGDGWLRRRFTELGVIEYEHGLDTGEGYEELQVGTAAPAS